MLSGYAGKPCPEYVPNYANLRPSELRSGLQKWLDRPVALASKVAKVEICASGGVRTGGCGHSRISRALRDAGADVEFCSPEFECAWIELVQAGWCLQNGPCVAQKLSRVGRAHGGNDTHSHGIWVAFPCS